MNLNELIKVNKTFNEVNKTMITDIIDSGITIVYGIAGVGKTYSTIKHLNRFKTKPILLDFDNNDRDMNGLDYIKLNGGYFVDNFDKSPTNEDYKIERDELMFELGKIIKEHTKKDVYYGNVIYERVTSSIQESVNFIVKNNLNRSSDLVDRIKAFTRLKLQPIEIISNETILIDTYQSAMLLFDNDINDFKSFLDVLLKHNNNIVLIAHSKTLGNNEIVDMDEVFANHCDAKIRLTRSQTKTKDESFCLFVEKLRGYNGKTKIIDWER